MSVILHKTVASYLYRSSLKPESIEMSPDRFMLIPFVILAVNLMLISYDSKQATRQSRISAVRDHMKHRPEKRCKRFYLDIGSNIGVQVRKLFEPSRYPNAPVLPLFDEYFGTQRNQDKGLCAIGVEMNPHHDARLLALQQHYQHTCGYAFHVMNGTAASTFDGETVFWSDNQFQYNEWGASTIRSDRSSEPVSVRAIDLATFILHEIKPIASTIVMKLDIEGSEYEVLPHLVAKGALCDVDLAFIEIHKTSSHKKDILHHALSLLKDGSEIGCKVKILTLDDETFLHDADKTINTC